MPTTSLTLTVSDLVFNQGEEIRTNSLKVAEAFNKRHDDVLRKLRNLECSSDFIDRNFAGNEYKDGTGRKLPMFEMTKNGFMFLVMGFTGKKAAAIKEAYINAFDKMAEQLRAIVPALPQQQNQLTEHCNLPQYFESGWIPALWQRQPTHVRHAWIHHVKIKVHPHSFKNKLCGHVILGIGGEGESQPDHSTESGAYRNQGYYYEFRLLDELWENIREDLLRMNAVSPF
ncbi:Rha family transcriptional regulator [Vibrio sp. HN007]|uniref:Rha family transcriptional regulator n=1 Tax=Vibrio iocasae TaxID=3098914 RepID=UPI0035D3FC70